MVVQRDKKSPVLMKGQRTETTIVEPIPLCNKRAQLSATQGLADVTPGKPIYIKLTIIPRKQIHLSRNKILTWATDPSNTIAATYIL